MSTLMLITLVGGVVLLLYGMRRVGERLQLAAGGRMRHILGSMGCPGIGSKRRLFLLPRAIPGTFAAVT